WSSLHRGRFARYSRTQQSARAGLQSPRRRDSPELPAARGPAKAAATRKQPRMHAPAPVVTTGRDLRLGLVRGIALWLIFLDHIPSNLVAWATIRNYGFSDATEIFVFVSGYTAAFVYGKEMRERGFILAGSRILRRAWQIYVAHVFLFAIYLAEISYVATSFQNPLYAQEINILAFLKHPHPPLSPALLLHLTPATIS